MPTSLPFPLESFLELVVAWIALNPDIRADRVEAAKEAAAATLQGCMAHIQGYDLAIWCAVASSARLIHDGISLDAALSPNSWKYHHATHLSVYSFCLTLTTERLTIWLDEWADAAILWDELLRVAVLIRAAVTRVRGPSEPESFAA